LARKEGRTGSPAADAGAVVGISPSGLLTVRSSNEKFWPEGTAISAGEPRIRGRVVRVFGPVARPYLSIRLERVLGVPEAARLVGQPIRRA
jgi:rRNA processing protein Gar1